MNGNNAERFNKYHMRAAINAGSMSRSERYQVGCVVVKDGRNIIDAWNGRLAGDDNSCEDTKLICWCGDITHLSDVTDNPVPINDVQVSCGCGITTKYTPAEVSVARYGTRTDVMHAEENTILYAAKHGVSMNNSTMYVTIAPCVKCAAKIVSAGIATVYYLNSYEDTRGLDLLNRKGVSIYKLTESVE